MRKIKFRIWNGKTKTWIHGPHENPSLDGVNLFGETILFGELLRGVSLEDLNEIQALQYTGLDDVNGKPIFEGDILDIDSEKFTVFWNHENTMFLLKGKVGNIRLESALKVRVVSNIFENMGL